MTNVKIIITLIVLLSCNMAFGQKSKAKNPMSSKLELSYATVNKLSFGKDTSIKQILFRDLERDIKLTRAQELVKSATEGYTASNSFNSIFTPNLKVWSEIYTEQMRLTSSSGAYSYYYWQFSSNDTITVYDGFHPYAGADYEGEKMVSLVAYRFDKKNRLLYIKWQEDKQNRELVLNVSYYKQKGRDSLQEIVVLHAYPHTTWDTPVKEILKRDLVYYETFIRSELTPEL